MKAIQAVENDRRDGIGAGRGRILHRLAANFQAAHGRGVFCAIEKSAAFGIAVTHYRETHGALGDFEIAEIERRFIGIEQRGGHENLIVERAFEARAADAMQKPFRFVPSFGEDAVERLEGECAAIVATENSRGFEIRGDEHRVPADVDGSSIAGSRTSAGAARRAVFFWRWRAASAHLSSPHFQFAGDRFRAGRDPEHIFLRVVMHFAARAHVVIQFGDPRFFGRQHGASFGEGPGEIVAIVVERLIGVLAGVKSAARLIG